MVERILLLAKDFNGNEYVRRLGSFLAKQGKRVDLIYFDSSEKTEQIEVNFNAHSITLILNADNIFNWAMLMNNEIKRKGRELSNKLEFDIIHGNDWITAPAAMTLKKLTEKPLVMTIHSTEHVRGFGGPHGGIISDLEWWSSFEADYIISCDEKTFNSLRNDLKIPDSKLALIRPVEDWERKILDIYELVEGVK